VLEFFTIIQLITYPLISLILLYAINDLHAIYAMVCDAGL